MATTDEDAPIDDLTNVETMEGGAGQAPPGKHLMMITAVETEDKGAGKGKMHSVRFEVMGGEHAGKVAADNFCMWVPVGAGRFKALLAAAGFTTFVGLRTGMLKGKIVLVTVEHETFTVRDGKDAGKQASSAKAKAFENGSAAMGALVSGSASKAVAPADGPKVAF